MQRHRDIAAAPCRSATATWQTITVLIVETLDRSPRIDRAEVEAAMTAATAVGRLLVAGGHLDRHPLTLVADPIHCTIGTVSGTAALSVDENLSPIPGGAQATDFVVHLPSSDPLGDLVRRAAAGSRHLSAEPPLEPAREAIRVGSTRDRGNELVDLTALARRRVQRP